MPVMPRALVSSVSLALALPLVAAAQQRADTSAAARWTLFAQSLARDARVSQQAAPQQQSSVRLAAPAVEVSRPFAILAGAQYLASVIAQKDAMGASSRIAVARASADVLRSTRAGDSVRIGRELAAEIDAERAGGASPLAIEAGDNVGRKVADALLEHAKSDRTDATWSGTVPTGPGMWWSRPGVPPGGIARILHRPWALASANQFRPAPPPAFGSAEFTAALEEVRTVARTRTAEQVRIAQRWAALNPLVEWTTVAISASLRHRTPADRVARMLGVLGLSVFDAGIACWDAKYHYWVLRPTQADSTIPRPEGVSLPNFPAYPSGHACGAGASAEVIAHFVPEAKAEVDALATEAAMSRLWGSVHYRFDNDVGLALGRRVARFIIAQDAAGKLLSGLPMR